MIFDYALSKNAPVAIRYPNGLISDYDIHTDISDKTLWEVVKEGNGKVMLCSGARAVKIGLEATKDSNATVINCRSIKPLDIDLLLSFSDRDFITIEDNVIKGGFYSAVLEFFNGVNLNPQITAFGFKDEFVMHGSVPEQMEQVGITVENIKKALN